MRLVAVLMTGLALLSGCTTVWMNVPRDGGASSAEFRYEAEVIPNAVFVRDNTSPDWELGRYTFKRGADRLLVISRITTLQAGSDAGEDSAQRVDAVIERVWITLPLGTQAGELMMIEKLEDDFLTGYDEWSLSTNQFYIQPNKVLGRLTLVEESRDELVLDIDMRVEPIRLPSWRFRHRNFRVPIVAGGRRAEPTTNLEHMAEPVEAPVEGASPGMETPPATQPGGTQTGVGQIAEDLSRPIEGQWVTDTGTEQLRLQLGPEPDRFVLSSSAGPDDELGMRSGSYQVKAHFLVLEVESYTVGQRNVVSQLLPPNDPEGSRFILLRFAWEGDKIVLEGDFRWPLGYRKAVFDRGEFGDMNHIKPPKRGEDDG